MKTYSHTTGHFWSAFWLLKIMFPALIFQCFTSHNNWLFSWCTSESVFVLFTVSAFQWYIFRWLLIVTNVWNWTWRIFGLDRDPSVLIPAQLKFVLQNWHNYKNYQIWESSIKIGIHMNNLFEKLSFKLSFVDINFMSLNNVNLEKKNIGKWLLKKLLC